MKTLFIAACAFTFVGCGPPEPTYGGCAVAETEQAEETVTMSELPAPLQALIDEVAKGHLVWEQDPVEERFFHVVTVTQTPPQTPPPPCPSCR